MEFTRETVQKLASMSKLQLTPEKEEQMARELTDIVAWAGQLAEVNTEGVEPTSQVTGLTHVLSADIPDTAGFTKEESRSWLEHSELPIELGHIKVPKVL